MAKFPLEDLLRAFDASSLHPSAGVDSKSVRPKIEKAVAFDRQAMEQNILETFINQTIGLLKKSIFLRVKNYNPRHLKFQRIPRKEMVALPSRRKKIEVKRLRNGKITRIVRTVDLREVVRSGEEVVELYLGYLCITSKKVFL